MARDKKQTPAPEVQPAVEAQSYIADLSLEELVSLKAEVEQLIGQKQKETKKELYSKMMEMAHSAGFSSVAEFIASQGGRSPRSDKGIKMPPKYQNSDGTKTWSGKGRKPDWFIQHIEAGGKIEALEIK